jgi:hypothetical protein
MLNFILYAIGSLIFYKYFLRGIIWIVRMKLKYGDKVDYWFFPVLGIYNNNNFLGGVIKSIIIPQIRYGNCYRNIVLQKRKNPKVIATICGGDSFNQMIIYDPELMKDILVT